MLKLLGAITVLAALLAGCGSGEPEPSAATTAEPTPTPTPESPAHVKAAHGFEKGHSQAVRHYYGGEARARGRGR